MLTAGEIAGIVVGSIAAFVLVLSVIGTILILIVRAKFYELVGKIGSSPKQATGPIPVMRELKEIKDPKNNPEKPRDLKNPKPVNKFDEEKVHELKKQHKDLTKKRDDETKRFETSTSSLVHIAKSGELQKMFKILVNSFKGFRKDKKIISGKEICEMKVGERLRDLCERAVDSVPGAYFCHVYQALDEILVINIEREMGVLLGRIDEYKKEGKLEKTLSEMFPKHFADSDFKHRLIQNFSISFFRGKLERAVARHLCKTDPSAECFQENKDVHNMIDHVMNLYKEGELWEGIANNEEGKKFFKKFVGWASDITESSKEAYEYGLELNKIGNEFKDFGL